MVFLKYSGKENTTAPTNQCVNVQCGDIYPIKQIIIKPKDFSFTSVSTSVDYTVRLCPSLQFVFG